MTQLPFSLRLHGYWRSSSAWRVRIGLHWKGIPFQHKIVNLLAGEQKRPEHLEVSPLGHVPLLEVEEGGRTAYLHQSMAILEWLEERVPAPPLLPADAEGRARVRRLAEHVNSSIQPYQNAVTLAWIRDQLPGREKEWGAHWVGRGLAALEVEASRGAGRFSHGDAVTLADLYLVPQLLGARRFGVDLSRFPRLLAIEAACRELEPFRLSEPEAQPDAPPPGSR
ncbi:MAG TPA: maleylacetoacetate isomerase [Anaeromyxobacteraceae bacterium]|nr:maleylacetoacetate isomerase [Anaeromyxobacteraceae bacterium]